MRAWFVPVVFLGLAACAPDFVPRDKGVAVDPQTGEAIPPYPCPDWSQNATVNFDNSLHSNYGCAVNNNIAVQLENPRDLEHGRAGANGDVEMDVRTVQRYRAGDIPQPLNPIETGSAAQ